LDRIWREASVAYDSIPAVTAVGTAENYGKPQSGYQVSDLRF
jgi:hypothetical protein